MIPNQVGGEPLGLFFAEDLFVAPVASWYLRAVVVFFRGVQRNSAYEVSVVPNWSGSIDVPGEELRPFCVRASEYDGEVSVVDPASFPIYFWLHSRKPWVTEDGFVFAKIGEKKLEGDSGVSGSNI